jgi:hypothetical protein
MGKGETKLDGQEWVVEGRVLIHNPLPILDQGQPSCLPTTGSTYPRRLVCVGVEGAHHRHGATTRYRRPRPLFEGCMRDVRWRVADQWLCFVILMPDSVSTYRVSRLQPADDIRLGRKGSCERNVRARALTVSAHWLSPQCREQSQPQSHPAGQYRLGFQRRPSGGGESASVGSAALKHRVRVSIRRR